MSRLADSEPMAAPTGDALELAEPPSETLSSILSWERQPGGDNRLTAPWSSWAIGGRRCSPSVRCVALTRSASRSHDCHQKAVSESSGVVRTHRTLLLYKQQQVGVSSITSNTQLDALDSRIRYSRVNTTTGLSLRGTVGVLARFEVRG
jgi:hypothetical protein